MKKQNLIVLGAAIVLIAVVAVIAVIAPQSRTISDNAPSVVSEATEVPAAEDVKAYLVVMVQGSIYEPLSLSGEGSFVIRQNETTTNTVHVTPDSVWMEHSTCDNQDCVNQGVVSLENMHSRVLSNMIICLPNEIVLELHTPESLASSFETAQ